MNTPRGAQRARRKTPAAPPVAAPPVAAPIAPSVAPPPLTPLLAPPLALLFAVALAFSTVVTGEFVVDDKLWAARPVGQSWFDILSALRTWGFQGTGLDTNGPPLYRPLGALLQNVAHRAFGPNAGAFHLFSIALHYANSLLVFVLLGALLPGLLWWQRLLAALAFAVHPALVEPVAWISSFGEPLMAAFVLSAFLCYLRWRDGRGRAWLAGAGLLAFGAVLIKETALVLPLLVLAHEWLRTRRVPWLPLAVLGGLAVLYLSARWWAVGSLAGGMPLSLDLARVMEFFLAHLRYLLIPFAQPFSMAPPGVPVSGSLALGLTVVIVAALAAWSARQAPPERHLMIFGALWLLLALWPAYAVALVTPGYFAGRHAYLPAVGWTLLMATLIGALPRRLALLPAAGVLAMLGIAMAAAGQWRTDLGVYERAAQLSPQADGPHAGMATAWLEHGKPEQALPEFEAALARARTPSARRDYLYSMAQIQGEAGRIPQCRQLLEQVLAISPGYSPAWVGMGNCAWLAGELASAADHYRRALSLDAGNREAAANLAAVRNLLRSRSVSGALPSSSDQQ